MKGKWKDGTKKQKNKPYWKATAPFKREQSQKRRARERQALQQGKEEMPKFKKEYYL